jgi:uncharacterized protein YabE (DUF348 family)
MNDVFKINKSLSDLFLSQLNFFIVSLLFALRTAQATLPSVLITAFSLEFRLRRNIQQKTESLPPEGGTPNYLIQYQES